MTGMEGLIIFLPLPVKAQFMPGVPRLTATAAWLILFTWTASSATK